ncbi:hypothetical protein LUZ60_003845 [Juncus effusus]|nr:hypothetical protein LUZ60_003845 [Juncus effusus]
MEKEEGMTETDQPNLVSEQDILDNLEAKAKKYLRGSKTNLEGLTDKKLTHKLKQKENYYIQSAKTAARFEEYLKPSEGGFLEAENDLEKTWKFKQEEIVKEVDLRSAGKAFDMILPDLGPYTINYLPNGRYVLLAGRKGHLAMIDALNLNLVKEFQVRETVRDVTFLQNEQFFAVAQKKYPYIYNRQGVEIHCLKEHGKTLKLDYLEKHFLLVSSNSFSQLHYQDISTGQMVVTIKTGLGPTGIMRSNPYNSVISLGHSGGKLTMWKPTSNKPLITMLCHSGPLTAVAHHSNGNLIATAGMDGKVKIWDLRKFETVKTIHERCQTLDFSQRGLLGLGLGSRVQVLKDDFRVYMNHSLAKGYKVETVRFRPYEDVLGFGHSNGFSNILIPGSGEPNFDSFVANPFETLKQRRQKEVHGLLNKLPPESIMLEPDRIGTVRERRREKPGKKEREERREKAIEEAKEEREEKKKTKGRSKPSKLAKKKQEEVFRAKKRFLEEEKREKEERSEKRAKVEEREEMVKDLPVSLQRFVGKKPV